MTEASLMTAPAVPVQPKPPSNSIFRHAVYVVADNPVTGLAFGSPSRYAARASSSAENGAPCFERARTRRSSDAVAEGTSVAPSAA